MEIKPIKTKADYRAVLSEVDAVDAIDSALWLPITDIVACDDKLINTDDNETVSATRIR